MDNSLRERKARMLISVENSSENSSAEKKNKAL